MHDSEPEVSPPSTDASDASIPSQEEDLLPLSALQHVVFCERQFALIHVERVWTENLFTIEGRHLHESVDSVGPESRSDLRIARAVPLRCLRLGLVGRADVVEFRKDDSGVELPEIGGRWRPFPVEYKRGQRKSHRADEIQLCAQALCLEEMLGTVVSTGAMFYGKTRRRLEVTIDVELRTLVQRAAFRAHEILKHRRTPTAKREPKCDSCSLLETCRPGVSVRSARRYLEAGIRAALGRDEGGAAN